MPSIAQLRGTVFFSQFIGYTPENERKYRSLFLPDGVLSNIVQPENMMAPPINPSIPYGMPWRLVKEFEKPGENLSVSFFPGKIDIIQNQEGSLDQLETQFFNLCIERFGYLVEESFVISRLAFCPTFTIRIDSVNQATEYWRRLLKSTMSNGIPFQNVAVSYLLKKEVLINNRPIVMNFLHQIVEGFHITAGRKDADCILVTLDMNSTPEYNYVFNRQDLAPFFDSCKDWSRRLMDNIF